MSNTSKVSDNKPFVDHDHKIASPDQDNKHLCNNFI